MIAKNKKAGELIAIGIWPGEAMCTIEKTSILSCDKINSTGKQSKMALKPLLQIVFPTKTKRNRKNQKWVKNYTLAMNGK